MQSLFQLYRFLLGHNFAIGLQKGIGIFTPVLIAYFLGADYAALIYLGLGAMGMSFADQIDPLRYKIKEMGVVCILLIIVAGIFCGLYNFHYFTLVILLLIIFLGTLLSVYGNKANFFGLSIIFIALISNHSISNPSVSIPPWHQWLFTSLGACFYYFYTLICYIIFRERVLKQAWADCYFLSAKYLRTLSLCYRQTTDLNIAFNALLEAQSALLDSQQHARELIFNADLSKNPLYARYATELLTLIDMHERMIFSIQDFTAMRAYFANSDIQIFFRDLNEKSANNLDEIAFSLLGAHTTPRRLGLKAELRALEYEIELQKQANLQTQQPEIYSLLTQHYRKSWTLSRQINRLRKIQNNEFEHDELVLTNHLRKFISARTWPLQILTQHLSDFSPAVKHSLRLTLAVLSSLILLEVAQRLLSHGFWIIFTIIFIMRSSFFSITRQRTKERITGSLLGCVLAGFIMAWQLNAIGLIAIMFCSIVISTGLLTIRYDLSTAFNSVYILLASSFAYQNGAYALAVERIVDTIIAAGITIAFSFFLPSWEKNNSQKLKYKVLENLYELILKIENVFFQKSEEIVEYRLARKQLQYALSNQSNSLKRMQKEPQKQQENLESLSLFTINNQALLAELTAFVHDLKRLELDPRSIPELHESFQVICYKAKQQLQNELTDDEQDKNQEHKYLQVKEIKPLIWQLERALQVQNKEKLLEVNIAAPNKESL